MTRESLPHWDLSNVYPGLESEEFGQAISQIKAQLENLDQYLGTKEIARIGTSKRCLSRRTERAPPVGGRSRMIKEGSTFS